MKICYLEVENLKTNKPWNSSLKLLHVLKWCEMKVISKDFSWGSVVFWSVRPTVYLHFTGFLLKSIFLREWDSTNSTEYNFISYKSYWQFLNETRTTGCLPRIIIMFHLIKAHLFCLLNVTDSTLYMLNDISGAFRMCPLYCKFLRYLQCPICTQKDLSDSFLLTWW